MTDEIYSRIERELEVKVYIQNLKFATPFRFREKALHVFLFHYNETITVVNINREEVITCPTRKKLTLIC